MVQQGSGRRSAGAIDNDRDLPYGLNHLEAGGNAVSEITFEAKDGQGVLRTWRYKDKPRRIEPGEYYLRPMQQHTVSVDQWPSDCARSMDDGIPVEPVEPERVSLSLTTEHAKAVVFGGIVPCSQSTQVDLLQQLREQGVDV